ncbi:MAG: GNAT family N-acetyltransferase [Thermoplasmata archaeon]
MTEEVVPVSVDLEAAVRLGRAAVLGRPWIGTHGPEIADRFESALRAGTRRGALFRPGGRSAGIAVWEVHGPLGASVDLLYLERSIVSVGAYARFWTGLRELAGPIAMAPGELPGLAEPEEERLMAGLGLARFGRSEMELRDGATLPAPDLPVGGSLRRIGPPDFSELARLHRIAYHERFDRFLFLEDEDEERDAERMVKDLFGARWGEFAADGSWGLEIDGRLVGAVLSVRRPQGTLIADVMVDPSLQGRGIGRAVLLATMRALAEAGAGSVVLNVTEGNTRAIRLYEKLGFVRSLGPSRDWYDPARIPVPP